MKLQRIEITKSDGSKVTSGAMEQEYIQEHIEFIKESFLAKYKGCQYKIYEV